MDATRIDTSLASQDTVQIRFELGAVEDGSYHVVVDGVGRSESFTIDENQWEKIFVTAFSFLQERGDWMLETGSRFGFGHMHDPYAPYGCRPTAGRHLLRPTVQAPW